MRANDIRWLLNARVIEGMEPHYLIIANGHWEREDIRDDTVAR